MEPNPSLAEELQNLDSNSDSSIIFKELVDFNHEIFLNLH